jgi:hypothetical protein
LDEKQNAKQQTQTLILGKLASTVSFQSTAFIAIELDKRLPSNN